MGRIVATAFWHRLDTDGHDCCRLVETDEGWQLEGHAVFRHDGMPCGLGYTVRCDGEWRTRSASVSGGIGHEALGFEIVHGPEGWLLDGRIQNAAAGCIDLDLGFTPATNLIAIRRLVPKEGVDTFAPAAYYLEFTRALGLIEQIYRRTGGERLAYTSATHGYSAELAVHPSGFVLDYPGLWRGEVSA